MVIDGKNGEAQVIWEIYKGWKNWKSVMEQFLIFASYQTGVSIRWCCDIKWVNSWLFLPLVWRQFYRHIAAFIPIYFRVPNLLVCSFRRGFLQLSKMPERTENISVLLILSLLFIHHLKDSYNEVLLQVSL